LTTKLFDKDGNVYNHSRVISDGFFNETAYEEYSPVYMTPYNAMMFALSFVALTASITHVLLYYGSDLKREFWVWGKNKEQRKYEREVGMDIHVKMMQVYKEVPFWWYAVVFVVTIVISIIVCEGMRLLVIRMVDHNSTTKFLIFDIDSVSYSFTMGKQNI
jgi:hypothetical protein